MKEERLRYLKQEVDSNPDDTFSRYALAMEYLDADPASAWENLKYLLKNHPSYLPAYYTSAKFLADSEQSDSAKQIAALGIEVAESQKDPKTAEELKRLIASVE